MKFEYSEDDVLEKKYNGNQLIKVKLKDGTLVEYNLGDCYVTKANGDTACYYGDGECFLSNFSTGKLIRYSDGTICSIYDIKHKTEIYNVDSNGNGFCFIDGKEYSIWNNVYYGSDCNGEYEIDENGNITINKIISQIITDDKGIKYRYYNGVLEEKIYPNGFSISYFDDEISIWGNEALELSYYDHNLVSADGEILVSNVTDFDINELDDIFIKTTGKEDLIYNFRLLSEKKNYDDIKYSKRYNSIDVDEEKYYEYIEAILRVIDNKESSLTKLKNINNNVSSFADKFEELNVDLNKYYEVLNNLKEQINYSILAYQAVDKSLKEMLDKYLIDSIFYKNDSMAGAHFKEYVDNYINKDGIFTYDENMDFSKTSDDIINVLPIIDNVLPIIVNGNGDTVFVFDSNNNLISIEGENPSFNFGDKVVNISYDSNGNIICRDMNGNFISIFDDYNNKFGQYGGDQNKIGDVYVGFDNSNWNLISNVLDNYFPNSSIEEKWNMAYRIASTGCTYTAVVTKLFKEYEGREKEFYSTFGIPMYTLNNKDEQIYIDYNYEPLIADYYCYTYQDALGKKIELVGGNDDGFFDNYSAISYATKTGDGQHIVIESTTASEWLKDRYGINCNFSCCDVPYLDNGFVNGSKYYQLYNVNDDGTKGDLYYTGDLDSAHAMSIAGKNDNGDLIVSSWGNKYIIEEGLGILEYYYMDIGD